MTNVNNQLRCILLLAVFVCFGALATLARTVKGTVIDDTGEALIGVTVAVKGMPAKGTVTDIDGNYTLEVPDKKDATIVFSYIGMLTVEEKIDGRSVINVTMKTNSEQLEDLVVVGYGQQKKASVVEPLRRPPATRAQKSQSAGPAPGTTATPSCSLTA